MHRGRRSDEGCRPPHLRRAVRKVAEAALRRDALTVHDDFQRRGLGELLLRLLVQLAMADGIRWFEADVMNSNRKMLNLFTKLAPDHTRTRRIGDVTHLEFEISRVATLDDAG